MIIIFAVVIIFGILLFEVIYLKRKVNKIRKSRNIQFSKLMDNSGDYGMIKMDNPENRQRKFFVEFKVIGKAKRKNGLEYLNIRVLNVSRVTTRKFSDKDDILENKMGMEALQNIQWVYNDSNNIFWFNDNDMRRRDDIINILLDDKTETKK